MEAKPPSRRQAPLLSPFQALRLHPHLAIAAGLVGGVRALSPRVRGGLLSIAAVLLGALAVIVALVALIV